MAKHTMGIKLPRKLEQKMQIVGKQIKLARLRRNLSIAQVAERTTCSPLTVSRIEKGTPTVVIGIYLRVLYALQLEPYKSGCKCSLYLETACSQIIPLAKTMSEKIRGLRGWADDRARRASRATNQELLPEVQAGIKKTKRRYG